MLVKYRELIKEHLQIRDYFLEIGWNYKNHYA